MKQWPVLRLSLPTPPEEEAWEIFCAQATALLGVLGIEGPTSPVKGSGKNPEAVLYFPDETDPSTLHDVVRGMAERSGIVGIELAAVELLPEQDWGAGWRQYFRRTHVSERIYVAPPWEAELPSDAPAGAFLVAIEPGQAFGTGTHPTTRLCLALLETQVRPDSGSVLFDMGAGSGILSIAAVLLGADAALGLEKDPICRENYLLNAQMNKVADKVHLIEGSVPREALESALLLGVHPPDLVVCNMLVTEFEPQLPELHRIPAPMILSGFLTSEKETIRDLVRANGYSVSMERDLEEWSAFVLARETQATDK
jgi:ribosomal protein L11 methyltransferase